MALKKWATAARCRPAVARIVALATCAALGASPARAEPTAQERAASEALFREAKKLALADQIPEACAKFAESQRLDPRLGTLLYLATCHAQEGKTATAWVEFVEVASQAKRAGQREREALAREKAQELEARLSMLVLRAEGREGGLTVRLNGLEIRTLNTALPVDPGPVTIEASAPGKKTWSRTIEIAKGPSTQTATIPRLLDDERASPRPVRSPALGADASPSFASSPAGPSRAGRWIAGGALGGAGAIGVVIGSVFGLRAAQQSADADALCAGKYCWQQGLDGHAAASRSALVSTIAFGAGLTFLAAGAVVVLTAPSAPTASAPTAPPPRAAPSVSLRVSPGPGVAIEGRF